MVWVTESQQHAFMPLILYFYPFGQLNHHYFAWKYSRILWVFNEIASLNTAQWVLNSAALKRMASALVSIFGLQCFSFSSCQILHSIFTFHFYQCSIKPIKISFKILQRTCQKDSFLLCSNSADPVQATSHRFLNTWNCLIYFAI